MKWWVVVLIVLSFYAQAELTRYIWVYPDFNVFPMWQRVTEITLTWIGPIALAVTKSMRLW